MKIIKNIWNYILSCIWYITPNNKYKNIKFIEDEDTINAIVKEKKSICRFGDGEFRIMENIPSNFFQKNDVELSKRLQEVMKSNKENILIGLPIAFRNLKDYTAKTRVFWKIHIYKYRKQWMKYIDLKKYYCNSSITRCYIDYKDKSTANKRFENIKEIWKDKKVCIVEGSNTKIGVGNDLLNDAQEVKRIIAPQKSAFDKYNEILIEINKMSKDYLILIALGPTATVLAYDLANIGYQAIDIGHIDIEYEWFLSKAKKKTAIQGKYVNEAKDNNYNINIKDEEYEKSIIAKILNE